MDCSSNPQKRISRLLLLSLLCIIQPSTANIINNYSLDFYQPRVSIWGYEGSLGLAKGDGLLPLVGNEDNVIYSDLQTKYAVDDSALLSGGIGYRHVQDNARILGAYLFVDNDRSTQNKNFLFISPGLESLGNIWDFHGNVYLPISTTSQSAGTVFADEAGNYNYVNLTGHDQYDHLFDRENETGPGTDMEIGRVVPGLKNLRAFIGGYYFSLRDTNNMKGGEGRLEYHVNRYVTLEATDSYDNVFHNNAELGLRLTLGGVLPDNTHTVAASRILDPITRNISTISSGSGVPIVNVYHDPGYEYLERDNIYFFNSTTSTVASNTNPTIDANSCTFEHPCSNVDLTQANVDLIHSFTSDANFYLASGNYALHGPLAIQNGQSIWGRTDDYAQPANGNNRPLLLGSLALLGNNKVEDLRLANNGTQTIGLDINNASNITLNDLAIGNNNNDASYPTAINLNNAENININNTSINTVINTLTDATVIAGIQANNSNFNLNNSNIDVVVNSVNDNSLNTFGIKALNSSFMINNSTISNSINATNASNVYATAISADNSNVNINTSTIAATAATNTDADGIFENASALSVGNSHLKIQNSNLLVSAMADDSMGSIFLGAFGIDSADSQIEAVNNNLNVNAISTGSPWMMTMAIGMHIAGGNLIQSGNTFNVTASCSTWNCLEENIMETS